MKVLFFKSIFILKIMLFLRIDIDDFIDQGVQFVDFPVEWYKQVFQNMWTKETTYPEAQEKKPRTWHDSLKNQKGNMINPQPR